MEAVYLPAMNSQPASSQNILCMMPVGLFMCIKLLCCRIVWSWGFVLSLPGNSSSEGEGCSLETQQGIKYWRQLLKPKNSLRTGIKALVDNEYIEGRLGFILLPEATLTCISDSLCLKNNVFKGVGQVLPNWPALDPSHMNPVTDIPSQPNAPGEVPYQEQDDFFSSSTLSPTSQVPNELEVLLESRHIFLPIRHHYSHLSSNFPWRNHSERSP